MTASIDAFPGSGQVITASCLSVVLWYRGRADHHLCFAGDVLGSRSQHALAASDTRVCWIVTWLMADVMKLFEFKSHAFANS